MLNIKTVKNLHITDESKDGFCFRSSCSQTLKTSQLATEMADWNSSFTEADYLGMLSVMETIVTKYLAKGYNVTLPFGTLRANATGTCSNIQDGFTLGTGNHTLGFLFNANETLAKNVHSKLEYKQLPPDSTGEEKFTALPRSTAMQAKAQVFLSQLEKHSAYTDATLALTLQTKTRACSLKTKSALHAFPSTIGVAQMWLTFQFHPTLQAEVTV